MNYYVHPSHYHLPYRQPAYQRPSGQQPAVDPNIFYQSAHESKKLMEEASKVLEKLSESKEFDASLMHAAQASDFEEVQRLIDSIEINSKVDVTFNPDGLRLEFRSNTASMECCRLLIALRWR